MKPFDWWKECVKIFLIHVYQFSFLNISNTYKVFSNYFRLHGILSIFCFFIGCEDAVFLYCWVLNIYSIMKYMKCLKIMFSQGTISFSHTFREKFSLRYNNLSEVTSWWLSPAWHFMVVSCKQIKSHEGNWSDFMPARRSPQYHVNTPLEHNIGVKALSDDFNRETTWNSKSWQSPFKLKCCLCNKNCSWCI